MEYGQIIEMINEFKEVNGVNSEELVESVDQLILFIIMKIGYEDFLSNINMIYDHLKEQINISDEYSLEYIKQILV